MSMSYRSIGVCLTWFQGSLGGRALSGDLRLKICKSEGLEGEY